MPQENVIAVIMDCDGTLCEDTTTFLLKKYNQDTDQFFRKVGAAVKEGWDSTLAVMTGICDLVQNGALADLTNQKLREIGSEIAFFPCIPEAFDELKQLVLQEQAFQKARIKLELFVISGGMEELIRGSRIATHVEEIFGCTFEEDEAGRLRRPKSIVSFTEKTKFLFAINKGITGKSLREDQYQVNSVYPDRRVPFNRMIYIGDGPTDVPCFSIIRKAKPEGIAIGVWESRKRYPFEVVRGNRQTVGAFSANYCTGSELRKNLEPLIRSIGFKIVEEEEKRIISYPPF